MYLMTRDNYVKFSNRQRYTTEFSQRNTHTVTYQSKNVKKEYVLVIENKNNIPMTAFVTLDAPTPPQSSLPPPPPPLEKERPRFSK